MVPSRSEAEAAVRAIVSSDAFPGGQTLRSLLSYLVEWAIERPGIKLKAYSIGVDVMGRGVDFDPSSDAIVRVQVGKLRRSLQYYNATAGRADEWKIAIPSGGYQVVFAKSEDASGPASDLDPKDTVTLEAAIGHPAGHRAVLVCPFEHVGRSAYPDLGRQIASNVSVLLNNSPTITILEPPDTSSHGSAWDPRVLSAATGAMFVVLGTVEILGEQLRVSTRLIECSGSYPVIWSNTYTRDNLSEASFDLIDKLSSTIQYDVRLVLFEHLYSATRATDNEPKKDVEVLAAALPMPRVGIKTLGDEISLEDAARYSNATQESAITCGVLADKLAFLANYSPPHDTLERREEAARMAERAIDLGPANPDALYLVILFNVHSGHLEEIEFLAERVLEADPGHLGAQLHLAAADLLHGRSAQKSIEHLLQLDARISKNSPMRWLVLGWLTQGYIVEENWEMAARVGRRTHDHYRTAETTYRLAAAQNRLGQTDTAARELAALRRIWPTMSLQHFSGITVPRKYGLGQNYEQLKELYEDLAATWSAARPNLRVVD